jgi:hypothetical protein
VGRAGKEREREQGGEGRRGQEPEFLPLFDNAFTVKNDFGLSAYMNDPSDTVGFTRMIHVPRTAT